METKKTEGETINIGSEEEIIIVDIAKKLFKIANFYPKLEIRESPSGSVKRRCPSIEKLINLTNYTPGVEFNDGLKKTLKWYKKNYKGNINE